MTDQPIKVRQQRHFVTVTDEDFEDAATTRGAFTRLLNPTARPIGIYRRRATFARIDETGAVTYESAFGAWDVWCRLCNWTGTHPYPMPREQAFAAGLEHVRIHAEVTG